MGAGASDYFTSYADVSHGYLDAELAMEDLHDLAAHGRFHHVRIRLKQGLDPNGIRRDYDSDSDSDGGDEYARGDTPLICAARGHQWNKGRERHIRTMAALFEFGAAVNKYNRLEQTALFVACDRDLLVIAEWLMQHGADTNKACKTGETPLMCAYRNENAALVELLLRHGARVERPPPQLSCVKFPTLTNQVTAKKASSDEQAKLNDDAAEELDPPAHPHWIVQAIRRPMTTPETRRKLRKSNQLPEDSTLQTIHGTIEKAVEKEQEQRQQLIKEVENAQRIEDQRVYHAQLASESRKRRDRRRAQRQDASRLRLQHAAELKMERLAPRSTHSQHAAGTASALHGHKVELLSWERSIDLSASSTRPRWVAQPVWSEQQREGRSKQRGLVQECQTMVEAMQHAKTRRERLLAAPTPSSIGSRPETAPV